jgi:glycerophosphoryl diester phosphodiesterase
MVSNAIQNGMKYSRFLRLIVLSFVLGCTSNGDLDLQGHRGCRGLFPENSIPGFLHALEMGVTTLELDVHISKDGQVVVCHDPYLPAFCMP